MSEKIDLKELERRAFRSTFQDGLWDIFLGLLLLNMGGGTLLGGSGMSPLWAMVVLTGFAGMVLLGFWAGSRGGRHDGIRCSPVSSSRARASRMRCAGRCTKKRVCESRELTTILHNRGPFRLH